MSIIGLRRILNASEDLYFSEINIMIGNDKRTNSPHIPANFRCRMNFQCRVDNFDKADSISPRNISIVIPSAKEMIDLIIKDGTNQFKGDVVSIDMWKALVYYCQVFLGTMRNSPIQFSLSNADSASRIFDRFEDIVRDIIANPDNASVNLLSYAPLNELFIGERSLHLTLTQERFNGNASDNWFEGGIIRQETAISFIPLYAI